VEILQVSLTTLRGYVRDGALAFVNKSRGTVRPRMAFDPADIEEFLRSRKRRLAPYQPSTRVRKGSQSTAVSFLAQRKERQEAKATNLSGRASGVRR
jgi:hypothetical protein